MGKKAIFIARVCKNIAQQAKASRLPPGFLARLIYQESRFNPNAVSPVGAQGIAQFMPATARRRKLKNPFEPISAIRASARFLSDLRDEFGNVGLAAAAYNAGEERIRRWRAGRSRLPLETINYVHIITGHPASAWRASTVKKITFRLDKKLGFQAACRRLRARPIGRRRSYSTARWQPWGVHLTASFSYGKAMRFYRDIQRRHKSVLGGKSPLVLRKRDASFGRRARHNIVVGTSNRTAALKLCNRLKRSGGRCLVVKN